MAIEYQVMIIYTATRRYLLDIPVDEALELQKELFRFTDAKHSEIPEKIRTGREITPEINELLGKAITGCKAEC